MLDDPYPELTEKLLTWINLCEKQYEQCPNADITVNYLGIKGQGQAVRRGAQHFGLSANRGENVALDAQV